MWNERLVGLLAKYSANVGMIYRLDKDDHHLYLITFVGEFPENVMEAMQKIPMGKGIAGETARSKSSVVACNLTGEAAPACARPLAKTLGIQGMVSVPVLQGQDVVGTIGLGWFTERQFTQEETDELIKIGHGFANELAVHHVLGK